MMQKGNGQGARDLVTFDEPCALFVVQTLRRRKGNEKLEKQIQRERERERERRSVG